MRNSPRIVSGLLLAAALLISTSCSLVLSLQECESDDQCEEGFRCTSDQLCQAVETQGCQNDDDCSSDQRCTASGVCEDRPECTVDDVCGIGRECNELGRCQASTTCEEDTDCPEEGMVCNELGSCQQPSSLLVAPCDQAVGDVDADDAFIIGVLLPLSGPEEGFGRPLFQSIQLAQNDFNGIGGVNGRSIALLICDTAGLDAQAREGAEHLADIGVQAVIGPDYSSQTLDVATNVTIPNEMVLVSPSATAVTISNLADNGLVWRTVASDAIQGQALGELVAYLLDEQPQRGLNTRVTDPKLAVLVRDSDTYASGLRDSLVDVVPASIIQSDQFTTYNYPNISAGDPGDYSGTIADLLTEDGDPPEVITILGSSEVWTIAELIDGQVDHDPIYIFADAGRISAEAAGAPEALRGRVWGTAPQNVGDSGYAPYLGFRVKYQGAYGEAPDAFQFVANAFDALYVIAFGAAAGGFTGPEIAEGMTRLSSGDTINPNQSSAQSAINTLSGGGTINYQGASGPLNFDQNGDPQAGSTVLWCFDDTTLPEEGVLLDFELTFQPQACFDIGDLGEPCDTDSACEHDFCYPGDDFNGNGNGAYCTQVCETDQQCPDTWECEPLGNDGFCCFDC